MKPLNPARAAVAAILLVSGAALALGDPLTNEELLALRSAERIAELTASRPASSPTRAERFEEAFQLMAPILERPLPADRHVWVSLGRWAVASNQSAAGAVVLAGLRRDIPTFMSDETLAEIAASLNANTRTRTLATQAADRLSAGDSPLAAIRRIESTLTWYYLADRATSMASQTEPIAGTATWGGLAAAFDRAGLPDLVQTARTRAEQRLREIEEPAEIARALIDTAEGQIRFDARGEAIASLSDAMTQIRTLTPGFDRDRLQADAARLMARAGLTDEAVEIAGALDPGLADEIFLEAVRSHARRTDPAAAERALERISDPHAIDLATIAIIESLTISGRTEEAQARAGTLTDPVAIAEAQVMILAHADDSTLDPTAWRRLLLSADPSDRRALATSRIFSVLGERLTDRGDLRRAMTDDLYRGNDRSRSERITLQILREIMPRNDASAISLPHPRACFHGGSIQVQPALPGRRGSSHSRKPQSVTHARRGPSPDRTLSRRGR